jgi:flagellar M-ring protein FliF
MFEFFRQFLNQLRNVFKKLNSPQRFIIFLVSIGSIITIILLMLWASQKNYVVLFSNLDPKDAQKIREKLSGQNIPYKLETDGTAILVPEGQETGLRLDIISQGIISQAGIGYEIFDRPNLGITDFIQKINYRRALQEELARTIRYIQNVERARINIVLPEEALFKEDQKETTASVVLTLRAGAELTRENIYSIAKTIAMSVEGLKIKNVSIVDSYGNDLSKELNREEVYLMTANQIEIQNEVEKRIKAGLESMLNVVLGPGKSIVRVTVDMNFKEISSSSETYAPGSQIVRSEDRSEAAGTVSDTVGTPSREESSIINYEINKIVEEVNDKYGKIERISVSVTVDTGRTQQELEDLRNSIMASIGYNETRRDQVQVVQFAFDTTAREAEESRIRAEKRQELMGKIIRYSLLSFAGIIFLIVLRSIFKSLDMLLPKPKPKPAIDIEAEAIEEEISAEAQRRAQMLDQVAKFARDKPENVASLLATWLLEEKT